MISLTTLVYNDGKVVIMSINLICNIEIKINFSWNILHFDDGERVQRQGEKNLEFKNEWYLVKQIIENTDRVVSGLILTSLILRNLNFKIEFNLVKQIPQNTEDHTWIGEEMRK